MIRTLDPAAFWKLRAVLADTQRCAAVATAARDALRLAQRAQDGYLRELGIDPQALTWTLDDDAFTVTIPDAPPT